MKEDILIKIIRQCLSIDKKAADIYMDLSRAVQRKELKIFWEKMSEHEKEHVEYWEKLLELARDGILPQVFDDPDQIMQEIKGINRKINRLIRQNQPLYRISINHAFILTYRMEFYLLHRAFSTLFHFLKTFSTDKTPEDYYDYHINKIIDYVRKYSKLTPEIELLADTINILWKEHKKLAVLSVTDFLTDVLNRRGLFNAIKPLSYLAQRNHYNVGVLLIDIDEFKKVNDVHGHQKGDEVLKNVAHIIKSEVRGSDIIGRYGGDEYLVFLPSVKQEFLSGVAEKIRKNVEKKTKTQIPVTISVGAVQNSIKEKPDEELLDLIKKADDYMYRAKKLGRNRVYIHTA